MDDHILMVKVTKVSQAMAFMAIKITLFGNTQPLNIIAIAWCRMLILVVTAVMMVVVVMVMKGTEATSEHCSRCQVTDHGR